MDTISRSKKTIRYVTVFMMGTYILSFISPSMYEFKKPILLTIYVISYVLAFYIGALYGLKRTSQSSQSIYYSNKDDRGLKICLIALLIYTAASMFKNMEATGANNLGSALLASLSNAKDAYYAKGGLESNAIWNYTTIICSPIFVYASLYGLIRFKRLSASFKILYVIYILFEIMRWMFVGTNKGLFDIVILLIIVLVFFRDSDSQKQKKDIKKISLIVAFAIISLWFFSYTMQSRLGTQYSVIQGFGKKPINTNHILYKLLPTSLVILIIRFIDYLVQGYYGLSLGLTMPWEPTFLVGSNVFLQGYLQPFLGFNVEERLYQTRIERVFGWGATSNWHTMYLWLANDFSFLGVIIIMGIIGYVLGQCLSDGMEYKNPYALCLAFMLIKAMFYASANNQILGTYSIVTVIVFFILWKKQVRLVFGHYK